MLHGHPDRVYMDTHKGDAGFRAHSLRAYLDPHNMYNLSIFNFWFEGFGKIALPTSYVGAHQNAALGLGSW